MKVELVWEMRVPPSGFGGNLLYRNVCVVLVELLHALVTFPVHQTELTLKCAQITCSDHYRQNGHVVQELLPVTGLHCFILMLCICLELSAPCVPSAAVDGPTWIL